LRNSLYRFFEQQDQAALGDLVHRLSRSSRTMPAAGDEISIVA
jgi:hypothetical protein